MGLLDIPSPIFTWLDGRMAFALPPIAKIVLWGLVAAVVSMELYRLLSPQKRLVALRAAEEEARERLAAHDGEFGDAWPLIRTMLALAVRRIAIVLPATVAASLPVLALIVWLDTSYGRTFPDPGEPVAVVVAEPYRGQLVDGGEPDRRRAEILDPDGTLVAEVDMRAPVPVVHKKRWWNVLIGNPAGYLDGAVPVDRVDFELPRQRFFEAGPGWLDGWEFAFFATLVVSSLAFKIARRIQ